MSNPKGDEPTVLRDPEDFWDWIFFLLGVVTQAAFVSSGDRERDRRSRWGAVALGQLTPAFSAALKVAMLHPDEFREALGDPILLQPMPLDRNYCDACIERLASEGEKY